MTMIATSAAVVLARKLPDELARLIVEHAAAMTMQGCARKARARRALAAARRARAAEWRRREGVCVARFLGSFAHGSEPLPNALAGWEGERAWWERYAPRKLRRLEGEEERKRARA